VLNTTAPRSFAKRRSASPHQLVDGVPSPDFGDTRRRARPCRAFVLETSSKNTSLLVLKLKVCEESFDLGRWHFLPRHLCDVDDF
jgi:hypothetical protein